LNNGFSKNNLYIVQNKLLLSNNMHISTCWEKNMKLNIKQEKSSEYIHRLF